MAKGTRKPKLTPEQPKAQHKANEAARDQFAALGRFIQNFEQIVMGIRLACHRIMLGEKLGVKESRYACNVALVEHNVDGVPSRGAYCKTIVGFMASVSFRTMQGDKVFRDNFRGWRRSHKGYNGRNSIRIRRHLSTSKQDYTLYMANR
jgi:hypothetical protein